MKNYFKILIIIIFSNILFSIANGGSDGNIELKSNLDTGEVSDCFEKVNRGILRSTKG